VKVGSKLLVRGPKVLARGLYTSRWEMIVDVYGTGVDEDIFGLATSDGRDCLG
jgi:hypothetical protein